MSPCLGVISRDKGYWGGKRSLRFTNGAVVTAVRLQYLAAVTEPDSWRQEDGQVEWTTFELSIHPLHTHFLQPRMYS